MYKNATLASSIRLRYTPFCNQRLNICVRQGEILYILYLPVFFSVNRSRHNVYYFSALKRYITSLSVTGLRNMDAQFRKYINLHASYSAFGLAKLTKYFLNTFGNASHFTASRLHFIASISFGCMYILKESLVSSIEYQFYYHASQKNLQYILLAFPCYLFNWL